MVINAKRDYDVRSLRDTSRPSARPANAQARRRFKSAVLKRIHVNQVDQHLVNNNNNVARDKGTNNVQHEQEERQEREDEEQEVERRRRRLDNSLAFQLPTSGEKHHHHQKNRNRNGNQNENQKDQYEHQYDRQGQQTQQNGPQQQQSQSVPEQRKDSGNVIRGYDGDESIVHDVMMTMSKSACKSAASHSKSQKDYKRVRHFRRLLMITANTL